jgi:hypothetical protein
MRLRACMLAIAVLVPFRAFAQTPPPADAAPPAAAPASPAAPAVPPPVATVIVVPPPPAPPAAPAAPPVIPVKFVWGGQADTYYLYNFIRADGANSLTPPVGRTYDTNANSFTLALAKLSVNASLDPVSFQFDLGYGTTATAISAFATNPASSATALPPGNLVPSLFVEQAYAEIALLGKLTLDFGKFTTTAGAEVIEANKNWLYSRSILFNDITILHTGVRANLKISDQLTLQASLVNGWNNDPDQNSWKTGGLSAAFTANPMLSVILTTYFGKEGPQGAMATTPGDLRLLVDLVVALTLTDKFGLNLNVDYIKAPDDIADDYIVGAAVMGKFVVNDNVYLAARGEYVRNHFFGTNVSQEEGTLMVGLPVGKNFELRPEVRYDHASEQIFAPAGGPLGGPAAGTKTNQFTAEIAALAFF